jgi:3-hydroxybutyrate dehydrogenase
VTERGSDVTANVDRMAERFLAGRTALVTGGASGMGRAIAVALAGAGADVAVGSLLSGASRVERELSYLPGREELEATREQVEALGARCLASDLDVTSSESVDSFAAKVEAAFGKVDVLANAAGITAEHGVCEHPEALWQKVIDVNLHGSFRTIRRVLPGMIERRWGRIVNIASTAASVGAPLSAAYAASKAGVLGLTRCVALEGAPHGVTCNAISPSWVRTSFGLDWMGDIARRQHGREADAYVAEVESTHPQGRLIEPSEVAALALYLCRPEALGMTMQDLVLSGGSLW